MTFNQSVLYWWIKIYNCIKYFFKYLVSSLITSDYNFHFLLWFKLQWNKTFKMWKKKLAPTISRNNLLENIYYAWNCYDLYIDSSRHQKWKYDPSKVKYLRFGLLWFSFDEETWQIWENFWVIRLSLIFIDHS